MQGRRFCREHAEILDKVKATIVKPRSTKQIARPPKPPTVPVASVQKVKPPAERKPSKSDNYREAVLAALSAGPLLSAELAAAVGTTIHARTYGRARQLLQSEGLIVVDHVGRSFLYSLPPDQEQSAAA
jgi:hypothetical protein